MISTPNSIKFSKYLTVIVTAVIGVIIGIAGVVMIAPKAYATQPTVDLKTAAPFAILAGTPVISDAGNTSIIIGNVGLSPATAASIGLFCPQVTGTIYGVDAAYVGDGINTSCFAGNPPLTNKTLVDNAKIDLTAAYTDAAGRTPVITIDTELGGHTLVAGVYDSDNTRFQITAGAGPLVLDGKGDSSSVFIFEMNAEGTGLTVGPGSSVSLINGASACNVFWRVNTATIDTTAVFKGNILALTSITVANGANIEGRLLAQDGKVTLINDTISNAVCTTASTSSGTVLGASTTLGAPNTGFGVYTTNPWRVLRNYALSATGFFALAFIARRQAAKKQK
jgi:hypothetical protein